MNTFDKAFDYLMKSEGTEFVNNPIDSGGPTKYGITKLSFEVWSNKKADDDEIKNMTIETAKQFYLTNYWTHMLLDKLTRPGSTICIFDSGVLYGPNTAMGFAQRASNICGVPIKIDGIFGDESVAAINLIEQISFITEFHSLILLWIDEVIRMNPKNEVFRSGWTTRANRFLSLINESTN